MRGVPFRSEGVLARQPRKVPCALAKNPRKQRRFAVLGQVLPCTLYCLRTGGFLLAGVVAGLGLSRASAQPWQWQGEERLNILWLTVEDIGPDLSMYGIRWRTRRISTAWPVRGLPT